MMNIRLFNAKILSMREDAAKENGLEPVLEGEIWIQADKIIYVGEGCTDPDFVCPVPEGIIWDEEIDCKGNLIMPGLKDAHTHSAMTFLRSFADDLPLQPWLFDHIFPMEAKLTEEDVYWATKLAILEYVSGGITAGFDMYKLKPQIAKASVDAGFRMVFCGDSNDYGGSIESTEEDYISLNSYDPLISYQFGFHAEYTTSLPLMKGLAGLVDKFKAPMYLHLSETAKEVQECVERYGVSPVVMMEQLGMFRYGGGGFHCVHVSEADMEILKNNGVYAVINSCSNAKLASGIAPADKMRKKGIRLAIGTDGASSNNALDMWREMYLTAVLQKIKEKDAEAMPASEVLKIATVGSAHAMCLTNCDTLAPGKSADLILIDLRTPNMQPENHLLNNLVYSASSRNVILTMINGKIVYRDGQYQIGDDPQTIYREVNKTIQRMKR